MSMMMELRKELMVSVELISGWRVDEVHEMREMRII